MAKAKAATVLVKLLSSAGTGYFYVKKKNPRVLTQKLAFMKYDPRVRKHVLFTVRSAAYIFCSSSLMAVPMWMLLWPLPFHEFNWCLQETKLK